MGRRRKINKHLPQRVYFYHGRYWFMDRSGKRRDLGITQAEMYSKLAEFASNRKPLHTMSPVFDRYLTEALPQLAPRTQRDYRGYIENLRRQFGDEHPEKVTANRIFDYRSARANQSVVQANREVSCLSAVFREAIGWHAVARNPCHELRRLHEPKRTRYVTDQEYLALYQLASDRIQCLMDLATITGQREGDLLKLPNREASVYTDEGIVFRPGKSKRRHPRHGKLVETGKIVIVEWSVELDAVIKRLRKLGPDMRQTLFCTLQGAPYTESGFRSNWHRLMSNATASGAQGESPAYCAYSGEDDRLFWRNVTGDSAESGAVVAFYSDRSRSVKILRIFAVTARRRSAAALLRVSNRRGLPRQRQKLRSFGRF